VATSVVSARRSAQSRAAHPPTGQFVDVDGVRIHAHVAGEGPDLVLLHGAFGSSRDFTYDLVGRLQDRYRVIAFDRPGMGFSDHVDPQFAGGLAARAETPAEQSVVLAKAARALGAERPLVLGHSFGGIVALSWALDHDPAGLVLLAGVAMPWPGTLSWIYRWNGTRVGSALLSPLLSAWTPDSYLQSSFASAFLPQPEPPGYSEHTGVYTPMRLRAFRATVRQVHHLRPQVVEMARRYDSLSLPIEILHGNADKSVPLTVHSGPFSEQVPSANLTVLEGVGHMPHHADPEAAIATVDRVAMRAGLR
jgi:pimeloyl-ACP methyl ester carboxylesterase